MDFGKVTIINDNIATVEFLTTDACDKCESKGSCHTFSTGDKSLQVKFTDNLKIGDVVEIIFNPAYRIISAILIFFVPIIFSIGFYFIGKIIFKSDKLSILISFLGLGLSFGIIIIIDKIFNIFNNFHPQAKLTKK